MMYCHYVILFFFFFRGVLALNYYTTFRYYYFFFFYIGKFNSIANIVKIPTLEKKNYNKFYRCAIPRLFLRRVTKNKKQRPAYLRPECGIFSAYFA